MEILTDNLASSPDSPRARLNMANDVAARVYEGETDAFGELWAAYGGIVKAVVLAHGVHPQFADDIAQTTAENMLKVMQSREVTFTSGSDAYIKRVARNAANTQWRHAAAKAVTFESDLSTPIDAPAPVQENPEEVVVGTHLADTLLSQLDEPYRRAFSAVALGGMSYQDFAAQAGIPHNTAKIHVHRARLTLKKLLANSLDTSK